MLRLITVLVALTAFVSGRALQGRIVGGRNATIDEFPHQVSVEFLQRHRCGGSLIAANVVLTATHCVENVQQYIKYFQVRAGTSKSNCKEGQTISVSQIHEHPKFTENYDYDVAVIILKSKFQLSDVIQVIPLITPETVVADGKHAFATGWGAIAEDGPGSRTLQAVRVPKINFEFCWDIYETLTDRMTCYGYLYAQKDACQGDSGGPLVTAIDGVMHLVGVVSWGNGCARNGFPGVYSDIANEELYKYITAFLD